MKTVLPVYYSGVNSKGSGSQKRAQIRSSDEDDETIIANKDGSVGSEKAYRRGRSSACAPSECNAPQGGRVPANRFSSQNPRASVAGSFVLSLDSVPVSSQLTPPRVRVHNDQSYDITCAKLMDLGWEPAVGFEEGLRWILRSERTVERTRNPREVALGFQRVFVRNEVSSVCHL